jgi:multidrug efflux pump
VTTIDVTSAPSTLPSRQSLASFFIGRPVFAIVLAIVVCLAGVFGISTLPISQYPDIAPTSIRISAGYPGASAEAVQNSVTTVIEDAMTGLTDLLYMESSSSSGSASISLTFGSGVDADTAQMQVQNKVTSIERQLPDAVRDSGVSVGRFGGSILMIGNIVSTDEKMTSIQLSDIMASTIEPAIRQVDGVGSIISFGSATQCASGSIR